MLIKGLYAITPDQVNCDSAQLFERCEQALAGGARVLQYRRKDVAAASQMLEARVLREHCSRYRAIFIINDDVELARAAGADGVHLGRDDDTIAMARARLGNDAIIGASCYDGLARAREFERQGASYVAFGSFFPSSVKPDAVRPELRLLTAARSELRCPIVAIGGITRVNARSVIDAGAHAVAVISDLFQAADVRSSAAQFAALFGSETAANILKARSS